MEIKIIETSEIEELSIVDPKSGTDWVGDLLGNHDAIKDYDDVAIMSQEDFDWWKKLIEEYQKADYRYHELLGDLDNEDREKLMGVAQDLGCDLEDYPRFLQSLCDDFEGEK